MSDPAPLPKDPSDIELNLQSVMLDDDQSHRAMALAELVAHMPITAARELVYLRAKLQEVQADDK